MIKNNKPTHFTATETEQRTTQQSNARTRRRRTFDEYIDTVIIVIAVVLVLTIVCAFLVNFNIITDVNWREFTTNTLVVTVCTASLYILLRSLSKRKGRRTSEWTEAAAKLDEGIDLIVRENLSRRTVAYCRDWEKRRLDEDRRAVLDMIGIPLVDYEEKYCLYSTRKPFIFWGKSELQKKFPGLTKIQFKIIACTNRVRRSHYNPNFLISRHDVGGGRSVAPSERVSTSTKDKLINLRTVLNCVITGSFSVGIFSELIFNFTWEAVVACVIKLAIVAIFGVYGMVSGYNFATKQEVDEMKSRTDELKNFKTWCDLTTEEKFVLLPAQEPIKAQESANNTIVPQPIQENDTDILNQSTFGGTLGVQ